MMATRPGISAGRRYGRRVMKLLCRVSLSPDLPACRQTEFRFERWGKLTLVLVRKFIPGLSTIAAAARGRDAPAAVVPPFNAWAW